jgi:hypothetical protein
MIGGLPKLCVSFGVFPALLSDASTLSSGHCAEPNRPPAGAMLGVFCADLFFDIVCKQKDNIRQIINLNGDFK